MAVRTTAAAVKLVLMDDYGPRLDGTLPDLSPFIEGASSVVDDVVTLAAARSTPLSTAKQELVERWLAAHMYSLVDQPYTSKSTQGASASFQGAPSGLNLDARHYGQMAKVLDTSGCLTIIAKRQTASCFGAGTPPYYDSDGTEQP